MASSSTKSKSFPTSFQVSNYYPLGSYTSLKDLIPSSKTLKNNPYSKGLLIQSAYEIPISNVLVKKAAWVYLQPMPARLLHDSSTSNNNNMKQIPCLALGGVKPSFEACFRFIKKNIINKIAGAFANLFGEVHSGPSYNRFVSN